MLIIGMQLQKEFYPVVQQKRKSEWRVFPWLPFFVKEKLLRRKYSKLLYSSKVSLDHTTLTLEFPFQYEKFELLDKM